MYYILIVIRPCSNSRYLSDVGYVDAGADVKKKKKKNAKEAVSSVTHPGEAGYSASAK